MSVFQVLSQMKILTTALFFVTLLKRRLSKEQWVHLAVLLAGVVLITYSQTREEAVSAEPAKREADGKNTLVGLVAVGVLCALPGFAGVYSEKVLKNKNNLSVNEFNLELSFASMIVDSLVVYQLDGDQVAEKGVFQYFTVWTILSIFVAGAGGLLTGYVMRYANNVLKVELWSLSFRLFSSCCFPILHPLFLYFLSICFSFALSVLTQSCVLAFPLFSAYQ